MLKPVDEYLGLIPDIIFQKIEEIYNLNNYNIYPYTGINDTPVLLNKRSQTSRKVIIESNEALYILKEIPWYADNDNIAAILQVQELLYHQTKMVPKIVRSENGYLIEDIYGKRYFIQEYIKGYSFSGESRECYSAGKFLFELHEQMNLLLNADSFHLKSQNPSEISSGVLNLVARHFRKIRTSLNKREQGQFHTFLTATNLKIKKIKSDLVKLNIPIRRSIVHGDFNPNNMTFSSSGTVKSVYDFDNVCYDDPVHDIAEGLINFSMITFRPFSSRFSNINFTINDKAIDFLKGYYHKELDKKHLACLPAIAALISIELIGLGLLRDDWNIDTANQFLLQVDEMKNNLNNVIKSEL
ncbi:phosphotransferase [Bacillus sp. MUM 13]|uniref:phosphotransferase n=1 Tax=Bacillus sp. MUM 13 TaxID=1678001 RepID=UPI0008F58512|nr:phosphotransferase [Bacillus sp. MUM 13]OIK08265.1 hypothetical protein BIV59_20450 [Bacillus sp. MUM 13]